MSDQRREVPEAMRFAEQLSELSERDRMPVYGVVSATDAAGRPATSVVWTSLDPGEALATLAVARAEDMPAARDGERRAVVTVSAPARLMRWEHGLRIYPDRDVSHGFVDRFRRAIAWVAGEIVTPE